MSKKISVTYVKTPNITEMHEKIAEILSEGIYLYLKENSKNNDPD